MFLFAKIPSMNFEENSIFRKNVKMLIDFDVVYSQGHLLPLFHSHTYKPQSDHNFFLFVSGAILLKLCIHMKNCFINIVWYWQFWCSNRTDQCGARMVHHKSIDWIDTLHKHNIVHSAFHSTSFHCIVLYATKESKWARILDRKYFIYLLSNPKRPITS